MIYIVGFIILIGLSAFFSGTETALFSLSNVAARMMLKQKGKKRIARIILALKKKPRRLIVTILIGNNLANIGASVLATIYFTKLFGSKGPAITLGIVTFLTLVFAEIIPKSTAALAPRKMALYLAKPIRIFMYLIWPLVIFFEFIAKASGGKLRRSVSEEEIKTMTAMGVEAGTIEEKEQEMIEKIFQFNDVTAEDVMTPRIKMFCLDAELTLKEAMTAIIKCPFNRIPIYKKSVDNIVGVIYTKRCLTCLSKGLKNIKLDKISSLPLIVPAQKVIDDLFKEFQLKHNHIAIVVNEYGEIIGLVTLEDLLEELVGEIIDETDINEKLIKRIDKETILVDGETEVDDINDFFNIELPIKGTETISALILEKIGRIPKKGERIFLKNVKISIEEVTKKKINKVKINKQLI
ncbi:MAG: HlyC/CorC family transporter [Candidatus Aenigmarchaeota archaeon]|nr:HlyC/CorC family transporter [Candidatus Aenigmarchaeota archaeon]